MKIKGLNVVLILIGRVKVWLSGSELRIGINGVLSKTKIDDVPLRNFFKGEVGNGDDISFWLDPWLDNGPLKYKFPTLFGIEANKSCKVCDRVTVGSEGPRYTWQWRRPVMAGEEVNDMWIGAADKDFSVGGIKNLLDKGCNVTVPYVIEWCRWLPIKCNVFIWRRALGRIATIDALKRKNIEVHDSRCIMCGEEDESAEHLFTSCYTVAVIWQFVSNWCSIPNILAFLVKDLLEFHEHIGIKGGKKEAVKGIIRVACWSIWRSRNEVKL
ncbi:uncharacterized protein LOC118489106 [Helianthus annuus]|uniref:uncharacterized protein LOC118489106 n=1 Tax=Helianthus annuus TaxID=4232 RepID=UPI0016532E5F|nr:uncharacterized protein LOC118489106 [Helianthus annuus]